MRNPVFSRSTAFRATNPQAMGPAAPYGQPAPGYPPGVYAPGGAGQLEAMYAMPAAGPVQTDRVTYDDVLIKSLGMFAVLLVGASVGWLVAPRAAGAAIIFGCMAVGFVLAMINIFKRQKSRALITLYSAVEGIFVGGISRLFEAWYPGIVVQAVIASLCVFGVTLALFASGKIRASSRMTKIALVALCGYLVFSLVNLVLMMSGAMPGQAFGMRSVEVFGIPLGVIMGIAAVLLAAYCLVVDFDSIKVAVQNGAPAKIAWTCAFGLVVDMVFLYLEILRVLAILNRN